MSKYLTLDELFSREEDKRFAAYRAEAAAEKAAWDALPQAEKDRIIAESEARWNEMDTSATDDEDEDEEEGD